MGSSWGDGSGTGAGGTFNLAGASSPTDVTQLDIWKGIWDVPVLSFSSNWKEMRTLLTTIEIEMENSVHIVTNRRLLYFTDNMVTYDVFRGGTSKSNALWTLFQRIKLLELQLQCQVQVIHVPGTTMILQGTDGLSRGVTMQQLSSHNGNTLIPSLWQAAPASSITLQWAFSILPPLFLSTAPWIF